MTWLEAIGLLSIGAIIGMTCMAVVSVNRGPSIQDDILDRVYPDRRRS